MNDTIRQTIFSQLGGNRFLAMTGAQCMATEKGLQIKLPSMSLVSCFVVTLDEVTDTYVIETYKGRGLKMKRNPPIYQIHAEQLASTFTACTGLATSL